MIGNNPLYIPKKAVDNLVLFLFLSYVVGLFTFLVNFCKIVFGISLQMLIIPIGLVFPMLYFFYLSYRKKKIVLPHFFIFLLITLLFIFFESSLFRGKTESNYVYAYYMFLVYSIFVTLVNYGKSKHKYQRVIKYCIGICSILITMQYLIYFGVIGSEFSFKSIPDKTLDSTSQLRLTFFQDALIHPNGSSIIAGFAILLLIIAKKENIYTLKKITYYPLLSLFFVMILLNASRGAFILVLLITIIKVYSFSLKLKLLIFSTLIVITFTALNFFDDYIDDIFIIQRIVETDTNTERARQASLAFSNFLKNPFTGVGYHFATLNSKYTRANLSYAQILASHGIFYFVLYIIFLSRMWVHNIRSKESLMMMSFSLVATMFYNWSILLNLAILSYLLHSSIDE